RGTARSARAVRLLCRRECPETDRWHQVGPGDAGCPAAAAIVERPGEGVDARVRSRPRDRVGGRRAGVRRGERALARLGTRTFFFALRLYQFVYRDRLTVAEPG